MHNERRHAIEGIKLFCLHQCLLCADLRDVTCRLTTRGLQQVANFPVDINCHAGTSQNNKSNKVGSIAQRNNQPSVRQRSQPYRQSKIRVIGR